MTRHPPPATRTLESRICRGVALLTLIAAIACRGEATDAVTTGRTGAIRVRVSMTGVELPVSYTVRADAYTAYANRGDDALVRQVERGVRIVELSLASNCRVEGENAQRVAVTAGQTTTVSFAVTCLSTTGFVRVTTATSGVDLDANGYQVMASWIDGLNMPNEETQALPAGATLVLSFPVGAIRLALRGIATNCIISGFNRNASPSCHRIP